MNYIEDNIKIYLIFFRYKKSIQFIYEKTIEHVPNFTQAILNIRNRAIIEEKGTELEVLSVTQLTQDELDTLDLARLTRNLNEVK